MKPYALFLTLTLLLFGSFCVSAQQALPERDGFEFGLRAGYDSPLFDLPYRELDYRGDRYFGLHAGYRFNDWLGVRAQYANLRTNPFTTIPDSIMVGGNSEATTADFRRMRRHFVGIGPSLRTTLGSPRWTLDLTPSVGRSWISGGDARVNAPSGTQLVNTGFTDAVWSGKAQLELGWRISPAVSVTAGAYYLRHFAVHPHDFLDLSPTGTLPITHGENVYDHTANPYTLTNQAPEVIPTDPDGMACVGLSSVGVALGLNVHLTRPAKVVEKEECNDCGVSAGCNIVVTVRDEPTGQVIPAADVVLKTLDGQIVASSTTNSYGVVTFQGVAPGNYALGGQVVNVATTNGSIGSTEFRAGEVIRKELLYRDLRFILRGVTRNKGTQLAEPAVLVRLTNQSSGGVTQNNSDAAGDFMFQLEPNASYRLVGSKQSRLSDIEAASTVGLTRSTTLFVDLELGVEDFDCSHGAILDVKYELDEDRLTPTARFELDRLVNYLLDHPTDRVELSSHTDSRGSKSYNQSLSERRAASAVSYIISRGVAPERIVARGYGESRLLNHCADGVDCAETQHARNRRTEASLICR